MSSYILKAKLTEKMHLPIIEICDCKGKGTVSALSRTTAVPESKQETVRPVHSLLSELSIIQSVDRDNYFSNGLSIGQSKVKLHLNLKWPWHNQIKFKKKIKNHRLLNRMKDNKQALHQMHSTANHSATMFIPTMVSRFVETNNEKNILGIGVVYTVDCNVNHQKLFPVDTASSLRNLDFEPQKKTSHNECKKNILHKPIKVPIAAKPSTGRYDIPVRYEDDGCRIFNTETLTKYCMKWVHDIFEDRAQLRPIGNTQTLILTIPKKENYFVQFAYGGATCNILQKRFQSEVAPVPVYVFHEFNAFALFMKDKIQYDA